MPWEKKIIIIRRELVRQRLVGHAPEGKPVRCPLGALFPEHFSGPDRPSVLLKGGDTFKWPVKVEEERPVIEIDSRAGEGSIGCLLQLPAKLNQ